MNEQHGANTEHEAWEEYVETYRRYIELWGKLYAIKEHYDRVVFWRNKVWGAGRSVEDWWRCEVAKKAKFDVMKSVHEAELRRNEAWNRYAEIRKQVALTEAVEKREETDDV